MLAKVVKPATAYRAASWTRGDDSSCRDNKNIIDVNSRKTARISFKKSQKQL
jgi:hypothetical protein